MRLDIGTYAGRTVALNPAASFNKHLVLTGKSGSGKTVEMQKIITQLVANGCTTLAFDFHDIFADDQIFQKYTAAWHEQMECFDAYEDGISFPYLTPLHHKDGFKEDQLTVLHALTEILSSGLQFGSRQTAYLFEAITKLCSVESFRLQGISALDHILAQYDDSVAIRVRQKLRPITARNIFRDGRLFIKESRLNILRLSHFDLTTQLIAVEIALSVIWRYAIAGAFKDKPLYIAIDECQNLSTAPHSTFLNLLDEGRKYGVNLLLSTQLLHNHGKRLLEQHLLQASSLLLFRPADCDVGIIARRIEPSAVHIWQDQLRTLQCGEFVLVGDYEIGSMHFNTPLKISAYEETKQSNSAPPTKGSVMLEIKDGRRCSKC